MEKLEKVIKGFDICKNLDGSCDGCPYFDNELGENSCMREHLMPDAIELLKKQQWNDASKRPPRQGRYLVWGLYEFTPDHNDQPNAYWQTRIATWSDHFGWDTKVKFWREWEH